MQITVEARNPAEAAADLLVVPVAKLAAPRSRLPAGTAALDRAAGRPARRRGRERRLHRARPARRSSSIPATRSGSRRVLLLGLGEEAKLDAEALRSAAGSAVGQAALRKAARVVFAVPALRKLRPAAALQALAEGAVLAGYRFDTYLRDDTDRPGRVTAFTLCLERGGAAARRPAPRCAPA